MGGLASAAVPASRENTRTDDRADTEAGKIQRSERTLHQAGPAQRLPGSDDRDFWF